MSDDTRAPLRFALPVLIAGTGLALVITTAAAMARDRPAPRDFGVTTQPATHRSAPTPTGRAADRAHLALPRHAPTSIRRGAVSTRSAALAAPAALVIPALQVHATVVPVASSNGTLGVPDDPAHVGWWIRSALPGAASGSVVIDGHIDSAATGPGALFQLSRLHTADLILVTTTTGDRRSYTVIGRRVYVKAGGLPPDIFSTTGPPRLVLISCGGPFDPTTRSYLDNVAVFAAPT